MSKLSNIDNPSITHIPFEIKSSDHPIEDYDHALDKDGLYPGEARDNLLDAVETEKSDREYQLSKYTARELIDELASRKAPF